MSAHLFFMLLIYSWTVIDQFGQESAKVIKYRKIIYNIFHCWKICLPQTSLAVQMSPCLAKIVIFCLKQLTALVLRNLFQEVKRT